MKSESFQKDLERSLHLRLQDVSSPEYALTWKYWDMKSGPPICALRASGLRTSGKGFGGWRTPVARNRGGGWNHNPETTRKKMERGQSIDLSDEVCYQMVGWPTPTDSIMTEQDLCQALTAGNGKKRKDYQESKLISGWVSPTAQDHSRGSKPPRIHDKGIPLSQQVVGISGWATPAARDYRNESATDELNQARLNHPCGKPLNWQVAETANNAEYLLNPLFSLWLQGFPAEWAYCVVPEIQSILGLQPSLFKRM